MKRFALALLLIVFFTGCGGLVPKEAQLQSEARYGELEQYIEKRVKHPAEATNLELWHLCTSYSKVKRYNKLFACLDEMQSRCNSDKDRLKFMGMVMKNFNIEEPVIRAQAWMELGDYQQAIDLSLKACQAAQKKNLKGMLPYDQRKAYVDAITSLGLAYALNGNMEQAEKYATELKGLSTSYPYGLVAYEQYMGAAKIYMALGNYDQALMALKWDESAFGKAIANAVVAVVLQAENIWLWVELPKAYMTNKALLETGEVTQAKNGFENLLKVPQITKNGEIYWMILADRGRIAEVEGNFDQAIEFYGRSIEVIEEQRSTINTEVGKIGFVGDKLAVYSRIISLLFEQARYSEAFKYVERAKARALVDMLASRDKFTRKDARKPEATDLIAKLDAAESDAKMQNETITADQSGKQRAVVIHLKQEIRNTDPELASLVTVNSSEAAEIQQLLPSDETLIEYYDSGDSLFAFIVARDGIHGAKLAIKELKQEIERFRKHIMVADASGFKVDGQTLYEQLIQPLEGMIRSKNLTIVPHGALHYLPFNALYSNGEYLIDRYNIRTLPSASVMMFLKDRREGHAGNLLALGNPDLGDPAYDLPWAQKEAIVITADQSKSKLLIRNKATETAVKRFGEQFRYLHFATHGTFDAAKPLLSGLLMTGDDENDGTLTVAELYDLHLPVDLVTLSACETGLGKVANGDDVVGFTRGFLYAGTSSIVSSLWKVDDQATSILMQEFYKALKETDKRQALRTAQLKVKDTYNSHPYFWAAFQISGSVQ